MNEENFNLANKLINPNYVSQGKSGRAQIEKKIKILFSQRNIPDEGWDDNEINFLLVELSSMDSNNFLGKKKKKLNKLKKKQN